MSNSRSVKNTYPSHSDALEAIRVKGNIKEAAEHFGVSVSAFRDWLKREGIWDKASAARSAASSRSLPGAPEEPEEMIADSVHKFLTKQTKIARVSVGDISDGMDIPPSRVRAALERLRERGIRVPNEGDDAGNIALQRVVPDKGEGKLHKSLLEGNQLTVGLVSDTHLSSNEEALHELHLAYDVFAERGITEVWHPGDFTCGRGIFRTQDSEIKNHTFESQVEYLVANYPQRDGVKTLGISGNHDVEGEFGKIGADPVAALGLRRDDIEYLGLYSAWVELPGGSYVHLLHGSGGMSYAYSYKAQKLVDGYSSGQKPALLCVGHWHVAGWLMQRGVHVIFPGCFEWKSPFLARKGLSSSVGFWILNLTIGDDGTVVKLVPEWHQFWEGRVVTPMDR